MSDARSHGSHDDAHGIKHYMKIYWTLLILFTISVCGPLLEIKTVTLITAFGIAVVKAYLVASHFMHLNVEKKYVSYLLLTALAFMFLFYAGVSPDVMNHRGRQWENVAAQKEVKRVMTSAEHLSHGKHDDGQHGDEHTGDTEGGH
jgi:caa(3)-type oxidase subunit IV